MSKDVALREAAVAPVETANETSQMLGLLREMMARNESPDLMREAFAFYRDVDAERARKDYTRDFVAAQSEMDPVRKDANNPQTRSKYASFDNIDRAMRPIYSKYGFAPSYDTEDSPKPDHVRIVLKLMHRSGHVERYHVDMPADGKGAKGGDVMTKTHAFGSAVSYGRRYLLTAAFNIITTERDDDGNAAGSATLTEKQASYLFDLIAETNSDIDKFLQVAKVKPLDDDRTIDAVKERLGMIQQRDFATLERLLTAKKGKRK